MLKSQDVDAFNSGNFWLDCPEFVLEPEDPNLPPYEGAGYIRQDDSRQLEFVLFAPERAGDLADFDAMLTRTRRRGMLVSELPRYVVRARDSHNRRWSSEVRFFTTDTVLGQKGVVCRGRLHTISNQSERRPSDTDRIWLQIPQSVPIPANVMTWTESKAGGELIEQHGARDVWRFQRGAWRFNARHRPDSLLVTVEVPAGDLHDHLDTRIEEALRFTFARYLWWSILVRNIGAVTTSTLRSSGQVASATRHQPIIDEHAADATDATAEVFWKYLSYIRSYDEPRYHPISVMFGQVLQASAVNIEAEALALGPAVEGAVRALFASRMEEPPDVRSEIEWLVGKAHYWAIRPHLLRRVEGALKRLKDRSPEAALRSLATERPIEISHVKAWRRIRHSSTHGLSIGSGYSDVIEACDKVFQLLVFLILRGIGYTGVYTDRTRVGHPLRELTDAEHPHQVEPA